MPLPRLYLQPSSLPIQACEVGRGPGRGGLLPWKTHLAVTSSDPLSHTSRVPFQIEVDEDSIDDGFRRLFAQLAGEVGGPQIPLFCALVGTKEKPAFVLPPRDFRWKGRGNRPDRSPESLQMGLRPCVHPFPVPSRDTCRPWPFSAHSQCRPVPPASGFWATSHGSFHFSLPPPLTHETWPLILDFHKKIWGDGKVFHVKNASNLLTAYSTSLFLKKKTNPSAM